MTQRNLLKNVPPPVGSGKIAIPVYTIHLSESEHCTESEFFPFPPAEGVARGLRLLPQPLSMERKFHLLDLILNIPPFTRRW